MEDCSPVFRFGIKSLKTNRKIEEDKEPSFFGCCKNMDTNAKQLNNTSSASSKKCADKLETVGKENMNVDKGGFVINRLNRLISNPK
jgi:hypothetical protein